MKSFAVGGSTDAIDRPSRVAYLAGHIVIGLMVAAITKVVFRQKAAVALAAAGIAVTVHTGIDAPIARRLSGFGI
jgi:hypothetical protein